MVAAALASVAAGGEDQPAHEIAPPPLVAEHGLTEATGFARTREGVVAFAVAGEDGRIRGYHVDEQFRSASVTKAMLMVAVLKSARSRPLSARERGLLKPMITASSNKAARKVYESIGDLGLLAVAHAVHMRSFQPVGALFETRITAADQARLFSQIDMLVPRRHRAYARALLAGIVGPQRWGIAPVAQHRGFKLYFKGGWRKGITHQVALLERDGRRIALAILTRGEPSLAYGAATLAGIAARVLAH